MSRPNFSKLYLPRLISLVILPVVFTGYIFNGMLIKKQVGINVVLGNDSMFTSWTKFQNKRFNPNTFRKFSNSVLTDDRRHNDSVLTNLENNIKDLMITTDTIKGYTVSFTALTRYQTIVYAMDICSQQKNENQGIHFILYKDKILVWEGQSYQPKQHYAPMPL